MPAGFTNAGRRALAKAAGHLAASKLGLQNPSRWAVLVSLLEEQWDGSFPELLETVQATA